MSNQRQFGSPEEAFNQRPDALVGPAPSGEAIKSYDRYKTSREKLARQKRIQIDHCNRQVAQIERMIADFERMVSTLDKEIQVEQDRSGIHDPANFAYSTYAKATLLRRDNLKLSVDELKSKLAHARAALAETQVEVEQFASAQGQSQLSV